ncbi:MAG: hypothetical protein K6T66_13945 [Peptococcaceae bacterium]|nr:hypothetical protein [Peptococcaceae bacterium]
MYHLGMDREEIDRLNDEEFVSLAGLAYFYEDRRAVAVKRGVLMALEEMFRK